MPRKVKRPIQVHLSTEPSSAWAGWVEDKNRSWILFFDENGYAKFYPQRNATGAVLTDGIESHADTTPKSFVASRDLSK